MYIYKVYYYFSPFPGVVYNFQDNNFINVINNNTFMDKALLSDIKKKIFIRSAMIALDSLDEILGMNSYLSADEILLEIIKKALREFEKTDPLILEMRMNTAQMGTCYGMDGFKEIKSNFTLFLDCMISEDQIILVPNAIPMWRAGSNVSLAGTSSYPTPGAYTYFSEYRRPYVFIGDMPHDSQFFMRGLCSRPIIPDFLPDKSFNTNSNKAAVYWMNIEEGNQGQYFVDLCMVHLLDYIRQLKASIQLPGMSMDILGNVDSAYQELRQKCDMYALQSGWRGDLLM